MPNRRGIRDTRTRHRRLDPVGGLDPLIQFILSEATLQDVPDSYIIEHSGVEHRAMYKLRSGVTPNIYKVRAMLAPLGYEPAAEPIRGHRPVTPYNQHRRRRKRARGLDPIILFILDEIERQGLADVEISRLAGVEDRAAYRLRKGIKPTVYRVRAMLEPLGYNLIPEEIEK